ncbi:MAG: DEAD/DEAH box helicase [Propionicimonas sp.]
MSELLPTVQAEEIHHGLVDYLRTTFALADADASAALADFLEDREDGIFKGPYLRLRLPFKAAEPGWRDSLGWYEGFPPYGHQAEAFRRLSSLGLTPERPRPLPTLVTTGTGSGKTEAFLYPIIDHVLRAKAAGITGMKALILYPMNALANDQAGRLAALLSGHEELKSITAALFTGQKGPERTVVSAAGLITDRAVIRSSAPDILLTNYKMLDQMLLREADARIWEQSAYSLRYLVLDEFHTYDGAQGTDVSMLLRRLGLALKSYWGKDDPRITAADWVRPLGRITPVATSATLGDQGDPSEMLDFAETVFGEPFDANSAVTESRLALHEWASSSDGPLEVTAEIVADTLEQLGSVDSTDGDAIASAVVGALSGNGSVSGAAEQLEIIKRTRLTHQLVTQSAEAKAVAELVALVPGDQAEAYLLAFVATLSHIRAVVGREALSVDLHLWVRELTRIDRAVSLIPSFHWSDDGELDADASARLPAIYCRHCGRSGWGIVLAPVGEDFDQPAMGIRGSHASGSDRFRPLIHAPVEGERVREGQPVEGFRWLSADEARLSASVPDDEAAIREGRVLPVLTHIKDDAGELSKNDTCPSCLRKDGIRFLGSAIATLLSVAMSTIFGTPGLDKREKKALVFTDSVQDAAHRAGFIQARSHSLTLRSVIREAVGRSEITLDQLVDRVIEKAGDDQHRRYRLLPPDLADDQKFIDFWKRPRLSQVPASVRRRVRRRLLLDVQLEFGLQSRVGRTLELTGSLNAQVDIPEPRLYSAARAVLDEAVQATLDAPTLDWTTLVAWARGVVERMRERGAIQHEWFSKYQSEDGNRFSIWGGRPRHEGMPAFPKGRPAPGYPKVGGAKSDRDTDLDPVTSPQSWYARWAAKTLGVAPAEAAVLAKELLERLTKFDDIAAVNSNSGAQLYQLQASSIVITPVSLTDLEGRRHFLTCDVCQTVVPGSSEVVSQLTGQPCTVDRCLGALQPSAGRDNFYRRLYASTDIQRVVAREHTSQLVDEVRLKYESGFKSSADDPQAPNVLVATPTLEMGIDIGDLSTVMLASLPRSVASYLQRVGRAGRLTGNSLNLAFVTGRGDQLPRLGEPLSMIDGAVRPPATYVDAVEILRRQYIASVADRLARDENAPHPKWSTEAMNAVDPTSYLQVLIERADTNAEAYLSEFLAGFPGLQAESAEALRAWATSGAAGLSEMAVRLYGAAHQWATGIEQLQHRINEVQVSLPELQQRAATPAATEDDKRAARMAEAALRLAKKQLADQKGEYWIGVLEERGILPNYTLIDDTVALDVSFSWIDPDTGEFQNEPETFNRGASLALRDFAPGATFYGRGHKIRVDAVELGMGNEGIATWVFCPACGYSRALSEGPPHTCPRCGSEAFADVKQRLDTVELTRVSSAMRREEATIDDSTDERVREQFTIVATADIDPAKITKQWFAEGIGFGVKHLRDLRIQWTNIGRTVAQGSARTISGQDHAATLFRVCAHCGQLDQSTSQNRPSEHRPWCPNRRKLEEHTRTIALTRSLTTEGLVVRLPALIGYDDKYAVPSLSAALLLGLRERIGGDPDHIAIETIVDPVLSDGGDNHDALLLHDVVPGGTGYLADLADPEEFWRILRLAWEKVSTCVCADENRLACHRCLLPFAPSRSVDKVSRVTAERHLRDILRGDEHTVPVDLAWVVTDVPVEPPDPETKIEQKFRRVLTDRLQVAGATVTEKPGPAGNILLIKAGIRQWRLEPQQPIGPAKPDFVLTSSQPLPLVAIFCDGWKYHANPQINRLADDSVKRANLRDLGHIVLGVSWADLESAEAKQLAKQPWFDANGAAFIKGEPAAQWNQRQVDVLAGGAIDFLIDWILGPDPASVARVANWVPWVTASKAIRVDAPQRASIVDIALAGLRGEVSPGDSDISVWVHDTVALAYRHLGGVPDNLEVALVLDDRDSSLGPDHKGAWNAWLSLSNALALRTRPTVISTLRAAPAPPPSIAVPVVSIDWASLIGQATEAERQILEVLSQHAIPKPELGYESEGGIPMSLVWPDQHLVVMVDLSDGERSELESEGWDVVDVDGAIGRLTSEAGV